MLSTWKGIDKCSLPAFAPDRPGAPRQTRRRKARAEIAWMPGAAGSGPKNSQARLQTSTFLRAGKRAVRDRTRRAPYGAIARVTSQIYSMQFGRSSSFTVCFAKSKLRLKSLPRPLNMPVASTLKAQGSQAIAARNNISVHLIQQVVDQTLFKVLEPRACKRGSPARSGPLGYGFESSTYGTCNLNRRRSETRLLPSI